MQKQNLLDVLKLIVLKGDCWHKQIEDILCNPCELPQLDYDRCTNRCPSCLDTMTTFVLLIVVDGLSRFLADTFINNAPGPVCPDMLIKKLTQYPQVGKVIYARSRSPKAPAGKYVAVTVLQLIASGLIELQFSDKTHECTCRLVVKDASPAYLDITNWSRFFICE